MSVVSSRKSAQNPYSSIPEPKKLVARLREEGGSLFDSLLLIVARVGANLLALVWTFLLARILAPAEAGLVFQVMALSQIASALLTVNVESGALRFLTGPLSTGDLARASGFIRFNRRLILILSLPVILILAVAVWQGGATEGEALVPLILTAAAAVPLIALARMTARHATAMGAVRYGLLPRLLSGPVVMALGLLLIYATGKTPSVALVLALYALSEGIAALIQQYLLRDRFAFLGTARAQFDDWRAWVGQGLWLSPGLVMTEYRKSLLIAAASLVLSGADVGRFAIAFSIVNFINFGVVAVDVAFSPRIARAMSRKDVAERDQLLKLSALLKLGGFVLGAALVLGFGGRVLNLFGPDYASGKAALFILLLLPLATIIGGPSTILLSSQGQGRGDFIVNVSGAAVTLIAIVLGGTLGGLNGAVWGAVVATAYMAGLGAWMCQRLTGIHGSPLMLIGRCAR